MKDPKPQLMKFIQACPPVLDDGDYRITVNQNTDIATKDKPIPLVTQEFSVKGPRFVVDPKDINSVFPPANQTGFFANCLPHIIIDRKTLAWERDIYAKKACRVDADGKPIEITPWLAVICFSKEEAPEVVKNTAKAIVSPEDNIVAGKIVLDTHLGESESTPCLTIDVACDFYNKIGPNIQEMSFLAHAKYVDTDNKDTHPDNDGYYSVIMGNRFPKATAEGETNVAHLISLEGLGESLPGGETPVKNPNKKFRFISLTSWEYSVKSDKLEFKKLVKQLNSGRISVPLKPEETQTDVKNAMEMGYTALNHNFRNGEKTVSWYRGPFVPLSIDSESPKVYPCADSSLKYNPNTGMFDISYSAAWQIGRLLALQNKSFGTSMYKWRRENNQNGAFFVMRRTLQSKLSNVLDYKYAQRNEFGDTLLKDLTLHHWHKNLGPKIGPSPDDNTGLLGKAGDPSGLLKNSKDIPGLLSVSELKEIVEKSDDPISIIIQKVKEKE